MERERTNNARPNRRPRRKVCAFCEAKATSIDFKDIDKLKR